jgi:Protein of unknown function (DUF4235)
MKLLYMPFAVLSGIIGTRLGRRAFRAIWAEIDDSPSPPPPETGEVNVGKAIGGAALQAAIMAGIVAAVRLLGARLFHWLFGVWPNKPKPAED